MKRTGVLIIFVVLILFNISSLILNKGLNKRLGFIKRQYDLLLMQDSVKNNNFEDHILQISLNTNKPINDQIELISETGETELLKNLIDIKPVVFFIYFKESCHSCVEKEFLNMKEVFEEEELQKIIILTTETEEFKIKLFKNLNQLSNPIYLMNKKYPGLLADKLRMPYIFVLNNSTYPENLFIPIKTMDSLSVKYYKMIRKLYW